MKVKTKRKILDYLISTFVWLIVIILLYIILKTILEAVVVDIKYKNSERELIISCKKYYGSFKISDVNATCYHVFLKQ